MTVDEDDIPHRVRRRGIVDVEQVLVVVVDGSDHERRLRETLRRRALDAQSVDAQVDLRAEVDPAQPHQLPHVGKGPQGIGAAVDGDDMPAATLDERVDGGVVEVPAVGKEAIRRLVSRTREELVERVEGPESRLARSLRAGSRRGRPEAEADIEERHEHRHRGAKGVRAHVGTCRRAGHRHCRAQGQFAPRNHAWG